MTVLSVLDAAGRRRSPATHAGLSRRAPAAQQGDALPGRPADGGGDRGGHAPRRRRPSRLARASDDRRLWRAGLRIQEALALAEHDLDHAARVDAGPPRQGRAPPRGRDGRVGLGAAAAVADARASSCRSGRCSASSTARPAGDRGRAPRSAREFRRLAAARGPAPLRAPPAAPRARARARPRGRAAEHHPAPARACQPRHHLDLSPRHRPRGDHHRRAHTPRADDVRQRRTPALNRPGGAGAPRGAPAPPWRSERRAGVGPDDRGSSVSAARTLGAETPPFRA